MIIFLLSMPVQALNGHISLDYDTLSGAGQGEIYLYKRLTDRLKVAGRLQTDLITFVLKGGLIPAGVPESQSYDLIVEYQVTEQITIGLTEGCKHYFAQSNYSMWDDESYIKLTTKYEF